MAHQEADVHALVVGRTIAQLRERRGWTQVQLAEKAGITQPTLSRIERGQARPDPYTSRRLADLLGVSPMHLTHVIEDAFERTEQAVRTVTRRPPQPDPWEKVVAVAGIAGLVGLIAIAVAAALSED